MRYKKNKLFIVLFLIGCIGIIIGAGLKLNGNESAYIALISSLIIEFIAILMLVFNNLNFIKKLLGKNVNVA